MVSWLYMATRPPLAIGEWYHCYNRGVDKRRVFNSRADYERFLTLLYICNSENILRLSDQYDSSFEGILNSISLERGTALVDIGAYSLMPNHFHLLIKETREGGIALFMQKLSTGYTMYFNKKYERAGALFAGSFKSKHVPDDRYFKQVIAYVLLNPVELFEPRWKEGKGDVERVKSKLMQYEYSSLPDFIGEKRLQAKIVTELSEYYEHQPSLHTLVDQAHSYYQEQYSKV